MAKKYDFLQNMGVDVSDDVLLYETKISSDNITDIINFEGEKVLLLVVVVLLYINLMMKMAMEN